MRGTSALRRLAVGGWIALGTLALVLSPTATEPSRAESTLRYRTIPTSLSAAPDGTMAFRRVLAKLGFEVADHVKTGAPDAQALVLTGHVHPMGEPERESILTWLRNGGRLVYARQVPPSAPEEPEPVEELFGGPVLDAPEEAMALEVDLLAEGSLAPVEGPKGARAYRLGQGRFVILDDGGARLSNQKLESEGLTRELPWLRFVFEGISVVAFDEVRNGAASDESIFAVAGRAGLGPGLTAAAAALLIWVLVLGTRREPPVATPPQLEQSYRRHLASVGALLESGGRVALCRQALLEGTRRRLGPLSARPEVAGALNAADRSTRVLDVARRLERIERDSGTSGAIASRRPIRQIGKP